MELMPGLFAISSDHFFAFGKTLPKLDLGSVVFQCRYTFMTIFPTCAPCSANSLHWRDLNYNCYGKIESELDGFEVEYCSVKTGLHFL